MIEEANDGLEVIVAPKTSDEEKTSVGVIEGLGELPYSIVEIFNNLPSSAKERILQSKSGGAGPTEEVKKEEVGM